MRRATGTVTQTDEQATRLAARIHTKAGRGREVRTVRVPFGAPQAMIDTAIRALIPEEFVPRNLQVNTRLSQARFTLDISFGRDDRLGDISIELTLKQEDLSAVISYIGAHLDTSYVFINGIFPDDEEGDDDGGEELPLPAAPPVDLETIDAPATRH